MAYASPTAQISPSLFKLSKEPVCDAGTERPGPWWRFWSTILRAAACVTCAVPSLSNRFSRWPRFSKQASSLWAQSALKGAAVSFLVAVHFGSERIV